MHLARPASFCVRQSRTLVTVLTVQAGVRQVALWDNSVTQLLSCSSAISTRGLKIILALPASQQVGEVG